MNLRPKLAGAEILSRPFGLLDIYADRRARGFDLRQNTFDMREELCALLGDPYRARGAVEEACTELILQRLDTFRYGSWREPQLGTDGGQVLHRGDAGKNTHVLDVHSTYLSAAASAHIARAPTLLARTALLDYAYAASPGRAL